MMKTIQLIIMTKKKRFKLKNIKETLSLFIFCIRFFSVSFLLFLLNWPFSYLNLVLIFQGFDVADGGGILLISDVIREMLKIPCAALMGANIANEVAKENYCEATIGNIWHLHYRSTSLYFMKLESWYFKTMKFLNRIPMIACKYHQLFMLSLCNILVHVYKSFEEKNKYQTAFQV